MLGSGKAESYQSQITPNFNQPQQIYPKQKQPTKISLISLKSNVLQTSVFLKKSQLYSRYHSQGGALRLCLFSAGAQQQLASRYRDSQTGKGPGLPGVGGPLNGPLPGKKQETMGGPVRPRN